MSSIALLRLRPGDLAPGRPYVERHEEDIPWLDRAARAALGEADGIILAQVARKAPRVAEQCRQPAAGTAGELNYLVTQHIVEFVKKHGLSYQTINDIVGALEALEYVHRFGEDKLAGMVLVAVALTWKPRPAHHRPIQIGTPMNSAIRASGIRMASIVATSDSPTGPFKKQSNPVFTSKDSSFAAEDPFIWYGTDRYWAIVKDFSGSFTNSGTSLALFESADGFSWKPAAHPLVSTLKLKWADGKNQKLLKLERPQLLMENGEPAVLFCAAAPEGKLNDSFNIQIPLISTPKLRPGNRDRADAE